MSELEQKFDLEMSQKNFSGWITIFFREEGPHSDRTPVCTGMSPMVSRVFFLENIWCIGPDSEIKSKFQPKVRSREFFS